MSDSFSLLTDAEIYDTIITKDSGIYNIPIIPIIFEPGEGAYTNNLEVRRLGPHGMMMPESIAFAHRPGKCMPCGRMEENRIKDT